MADNIYTELMLGFERMRATSEIERMAMHRMFAAFYSNDYLLINKILKKETLDNPYSKETLKKLNFQHLNITKKIINRLSSGIYTEQPLRELIISKDKTDENLTPLLTKIRYSAKVKDAFRKALYFNTIVVQPLWDMELNRMRLDVYTPDNFEVKTKNDFYEIESIKICKARPDGTLYYSVWNESEHYIIDGSQKLSPPNNEEGINPFKKIPFIILRIEEGSDFYGEPNWNLLLNQKNLDIRLTDLNEGELRTIYQFFLGVNTRLDDKTRFAAGQLIQVNAQEGENVSLDSIKADIDYTAIRENIDWKNQALMNSEGLSAQSGSVDAAQESGVKRMIDELELQEKRDDYKETLYNFEIELLNMIRIVNNTYNKSNQLNDKGIFEVTFSEEKASETISDKISRRSMEKEIGYKDEIDFTMEDLEVGYEDAVMILQERKDRMQSLGLDVPEVIPPPDNSQPVENNL